RTVHHVLVRIVNSGLEIGRRTADTSPHDPTAIPETETDMPAINPRNLIDKLNATCNRGLQAAAGLCLSRTHFHVEVEHWLLKLVETTGTDLAPVFRHYQIDAGRVKRELDAALGKFKTGNSRA